MRIKVDKLPEHLKQLFIADGLRSLPSPYRSPWFDEQCRKRQGNRRDLICNVCGEALGAADQPFDQEILNEIQKNYIRPPDYEGELLFSYDNNRVDSSTLSFVQNYGANRLKLWGDFEFGCPISTHNYILGCDPSYGHGSSNSTIAIYDVNSKELVGMWADPNTSPVDCADMLVALAYWFRGPQPAFVIWECNGGHGTNVTNRLVQQGYPWLYTQRREDSKTRKITNKYGWWSNVKAKEQLLGDFAVALSGGIGGREKNWKSIIIHDKNLLSELSDYVFREGHGIVASSKADLSTGALERHGDRVIAAALCILATRDQLAGKNMVVTEPNKNSMAGRIKQWEKEQLSLKRNSRTYWY